MNIYSSSNEQINKLIDRLKSRSIEAHGEIVETVRNILNEVRVNGDRAVLDFTLKFDGVDLKKMEVGRDVIDKALDSLEPCLAATINKAICNIRSFHEKQKENSWFSTEANGVMLGQKVTPLERVGVYVPGGTAPLPSSVLMNVIPAKVAGVKEIIMFTPPGENGAPNPVVLACAALTGVDRVFSAGGAQAIAAMAYGTETVPRVDKITGPGNIYVATAKKMVYGLCDIDMIAGPSEVLVIADETAKPDFVAADLLSQAEHDRMASAILVSTSREIIWRVVEEIEKQAKSLPRRDMIMESIKNCGAAVYVDNLNEALNIANLIAPEHLELYVRNPLEVLGDIKNAGAIFLGGYSPEPLGDYMAGPNHVLPTNGTARFSSPLSVADFVKKSSVIYYSRNALAGIWEDVVRFAGAEGLEAHANALRIRFREEKK